MEEISLSFFERSKQLPFPARAFVCTQACVASQLYAAAFVVVMSVGACYNGIT